MKTIAVKSVFESIVRLWGLNPDTASLTAREKTRIAELVNDRVREAYEAEMWPDLLEVEQRRYRATYAADTTYAEDEEVFFENAAGTEKYFKSLADENIGNTPDPDADTEYWEVIDGESTFEAYIEFDQEDETEIGAVDVFDCLFSANPRANPQMQALMPTVLDNNRILLLAADIPTQPWVKFRPVPPEFSWTAWAEATAYAVGDLVYLATYDGATVGQTFKAIASSTGKNPYAETAYWEPVDFPDAFRIFVKHAVVSDLQSEAEEQGRSTARATRELDRLRDVQLAQSGMQRAEFRRYRK